MDENDKRILALAGQQFKYPTVREQRAREELGLSGIRFWQEVNRILDNPAAHAWDPHTLIWEGSALACRVDPARG